MGAIVLTSDRHEPAASSGDTSTYTHWMPEVRPDGFRMKECLGLARFPCAHVERWDPTGQVAGRVFRRRSRLCDDYGIRPWRRITSQGRSSSGGRVPSAAGSRLLLLP